MFKKLILASALAIGGSMLLTDSAQAAHRHRGQCTSSGHASYGYQAHGSYAMPYSSGYRSYAVPYVSRYSGGYGGGYSGGYGYPGYSNSNVYSAYRPAIRIGVGSPYGYDRGLGYRGYNPGYGYGGWGGYGRSGYGYGAPGFGGFGGSGFSLYLGR